MNWLASLLISLVTVTYIAAPFLLRRRSLSAAVEIGEGALQDRRDILLRSLKELEFDHRTGKIDSDEFKTIRAGIAAEAASVLTALESSLPGEPIADSDDDAEAEAEILIEQARRLQSSASTNDKTNTDSWQCQCGRAVSNEDRFCGSCGQSRAA